MTIHVPTNPDEQAFWDDAYCAAIPSYCGKFEGDEAAKACAHHASHALEARREMVGRRDAIAHVATVAMECLEEFEGRVVKVISKEDLDKTSLSFVMDQLWDALRAAGLR